MKQGIALALTLIASSLTPPTALASKSDACAIQPTSKISSVDQARCLLRPVLKGAVLGPVRTTLPPTLGRLLSKGSIDIDRDQFRQYLQRQGISEATIGGSLTSPVSRAQDNAAQAEPARYLIIHDTSTPNYLNAPFPPNINSQSWSGNDLSRWLSGEPLAHVFINRIGASITPQDFSQPWRSTVFESKLCGLPCKGLFLSVELVQPRRSDPQGPAGNDLLAPEEGFTDAQLERLAVVYVAASLRRGRWLIPSLHAVLDTMVDGGHDDPQKFDLDRWDRQLGQVLQAIGATESGRINSEPFSYPQPDQSKLSPITLWSTYYYIWSATEQGTGLPLLGGSGQPISGPLSPFDWCKGAIEGTLRIRAADGSTKTYNHLDKKGPIQVDCQAVLKSANPKLIESAKSRYTLARGRFGDGVKGYQLIPYRSIAVDPQRIPIGSVIFIPGIRGQSFKLPNGVTTAHDGYFFAADIGSMIGDNHIDIFTGGEQANPFPKTIRSDKMGTFRAFIVNDSTIRSDFEKLHR